MRSQPIIYVRHVSAFQQLDRPRTPGCISNQTFRRQAGEFIEQDGEKLPPDHFSGARAKGGGGCITSLECPNGANRKYDDN